VNYLAHLYLSGESEEIKLGNFIGDYVKGNRHGKYPEKVAFGIILHRHIDSFTDRHPLVLKSKKLLQPAYGRHSGIVADVFFDHFLAAKWNEYSVHTLRSFAKNAHAIFLSNFFILPLEVKQFLPFLIQHKRLESYSKKENLFHVLEIMSRHTSLPSNSHYAMQILSEEYSQFETLFKSFFAEIVEYVEREFLIEISKPGGDL
jgi:acyl carrier protein phosphodiesterase